MRKSRLFYSAVLIATFCGEFVSSQQQPPQAKAVQQKPVQQSWTTWKDYLGSPASAHYSGLKQINTSNIDKLDVAWKYPTGDDISYTFSPLVVDNVAYFAAKSGALVAVDATTGKEIWVRNYTAPGATPSRFGGVAGLRGVTYWESKDRTDRRTDNIEANAPAIILRWGAHALRYHGVSDGQYARIHSRDRIHDGEGYGGDPEGDDVSDGH